MKQQHGILQPVLLLLCIRLWRHRRTRLPSRWARPLGHLLRGCTWGDVQVDKSILPEDDVKARRKAYDLGTLLGLSVCVSTTSTESTASDFDPRTLLGAPGLTTRNKKLLGAKGIATRSKDATSSSALLLGAFLLLGDPGIATRSNQAPDVEPNRGPTS